MVLRCFESRRGAIFFHIQRREHLLALVLSRLLHQGILIRSGNEEILVTVTETQAHKVRLAIKAPATMNIVRVELLPMAEQLRLKAKAGA